MNYRFVKTFLWTNLLLLLISLCFSACSTLPAEAKNHHWQSPAPIAITTSSLPGATVNSAYSATLAATGGIAPYTWSLVSGQLPTGLTLSVTGVISGTPNASGNFVFTVQVQDSASLPQAATQSESITVAASTSSSTPEFTGSYAYTPNPAQAGQAITLQAAMTDTGASLSGGIVDLEVYNSSGQKLFQQYFQNQSFASGQQLSYSAVWTPSTSGTYTFQVGVFSANWAIDYYWTTQAATINVGSVTSTAPSTPQFTGSYSYTPNPAQAGQAITLQATMTDTGASLSGGIVDLEVYNSSNQRVFQQYFQNQSFASGQQQSYSAVWTPSTSGAYTFQVGVFSGNWAVDYYWTTSAAIMNIGSATPAGSSGTYFGTLPPGSTLPSDSYCAANIQYSSWEPRPDNTAANNTPGITGVQISGISSSINSRIDGNFTGTTDELLQWVACKWGFDEDTMRAQAVQESNWHQSAQGDYTTDSTLCANIGKSAPCYQSYGILQIKGTVNIGTYPTSQNSTPFNADWSRAFLRACYEGQFTWLGNGYAAGDLWGCIGNYFSGGWYDSGAQNYINSVKTILANKPWLQSNF